MSPSSALGSLIQAIVGSFGGLGLRWRNLVGFASKTGAVPLHV
jgi:hypothetical protein